MAKYHITKRGEPGICKASSGNCPLGDDANHYETTAEARQAFEKFMEDSSWEPVKKQGLPVSIAPEDPVEFHRPGGPHYKNMGPEDPAVYETERLVAEQVPVTKTVYRREKVLVPRNELGKPMAKDEAREGERYMREGRIYAVTDVSNYDALEIGQAFGNTVTFQEVYADGRLGAKKEVADYDAAKAYSRVESDTPGTSSVPTFTPETLAEEKASRDNLEELRLANQAAHDKLQTARQSFILGRERREMEAQRDITRSYKAWSDAVMTYENDFSEVRDARKAGLI